MKPRLSTRPRQRFIFWTVSLLAALPAVSCAGAAPAEPPVSGAAVPALVASASPESEPPLSVESTPVAEILPAATSRGPNLEAVEPATVSLASGGLQLVEFFRFT